MSEFRTESVACPPRLEKALKAMPGKAKARQPFGMSDQHKQTSTAQVHHKETKNIVRENAARGLGEEDMGWNGRESKQSNCVTVVMSCTVLNCQKLPLRCRMSSTLSPIRSFRLELPRSTASGCFKLSQRAWTCSLTSSASRCQGKLRVAGTTFNCFVFF